MKYNLTNHGQDVAIDDIIKAFFVSDFSETFGEANSHAHVVDQNSDLQLTQLGFNF